MSFLLVGEEAYVSTKIVTYMRNNWSNEITYRYFLLISLGISIFTFQDFEEVQTAHFKYKSDLNKELVLTVHILLCVAMGIILIAFFFSFSV